MLRLIPLGGLGEIGLNSMVVEHGSELVMVDCGLLFPSAELPGIDAIIPDFSYLKTHRSQLSAVVLTHAHEDHLGALPYLLHQFPVPVYGTRFTLTLAAHKLEEAGISADLREINPGQDHRLTGALSVEPFAVAHSTPDAVGLILRTPQGPVVHTGDFKLDDDPIDGRRTDLKRLEDLRQEDVLCLLSDSTNIESHEETRSEREVAEAFERLLPRATGRIVIALFASNLIRLQVLIDQLAKLGRRVVLNGRSMNRNVELGMKAGVLRVPEGLLCSMDEAGSLPPEKVAILSTGAQAEPRSGLFQMLSKDGPAVKLAPGDTVIVSARPIPGNERTVAAMLDALYLRGAHVIHAQLEPSIHASGHASRPQQQRMIEAVRPRHFLPVHGEARMLFQHAQLARETGVDSDRVLLGYDGDVVAFQEGRGSVMGSVAAGRLLLDRWGGGSVGPDAIEERLTLADGILFAVVAVEGGTGRIIGGPELTGRGLASEELSLLTLVQQEIRDALEETSPQLRMDIAFTREALRSAVRRSFKQRTGKRPVVVPHVLKV